MTGIEDNTQKEGDGADLTALRTDALALAVWMVAALLLSFRAFRWE